MYYRRKVIFGLLEKFGRDIGNTEMQKLLFLITRQQKGKKAYHFTPYKFGCYSFQLNDDLNAMFKRKMINKKEKVQNGKTIIFWSLKNLNNYFFQLKEEEKAYVLLIKKMFENYSVSDLIKYTYVKYPFYGINSIILNRLLSSDERKKILFQKKKVKKEGIQLFTIGYEGITLEQYLNKLIINDVKILCDVRKNPFSMKRGFSKKELKNACNGLGIEYNHLPNLGIISDKRKHLKTQKDYDILFEEYENTVLKENLKEIIYICNLLQQHKRIALTCFEATSCLCHRGRVAKQIEVTSNGLYKAQHL